MLDTSGVGKGIGAAEVAVGAGMGALAEHVEEGSKKTQTSFQKITSGAGRLGADITKTFTTSGLAVGITAFKMASDYDQALKKIDVIFGDSKKQIEDWATSAAKNFGISEEEAVKSVGVFGNLFKTMGIGVTQSRDMSEKLVGLASDLGAFNNVDPDVALNALQKGMTGATKPLKQFGVVLDANSISAEAFALGIAKPTKNVDSITAAHDRVENAVISLNKAEKAHGKSSIEATHAQDALTMAQDKLNTALGGYTPQLTAAQKSQAIYALVLKQTGDAQGFFAKHTDDAAERSKVLKAELHDLADKIGERLLPVGTKLLGFVTSLIDKFNKISPTGQHIILMFLAIMAAVGPLLLAFSKAPGILKEMKAGFTAAVDGAKAFNLALAENPIALVVLAIVGLGLVLYGAYKHFQSFHDFVDKTWQVLQKLWDQILKALIPVFNVLKDVLGWAIDHWQIFAIAIGFILGPLALVVAAFIVFHDKIFTVIHAVADLAMWLWQNALKPTFEFISAAVGVLVEIFTHWWNVTTTVFDAIASVAHWLWDTVLSPIFGFIGSAIRDYVIVNFTIFRDVVTAVFHAVADVGYWLWNNALHPVFNAMVGFFDGTLKPVLSSIGTVFESAFNGVASVASSVWGKIQGTFSSGLRVLGDIVGGFLKVVSGIARAVGATGIADHLLSYANSAYGWGESSGGGGGGGSSSGSSARDTASFAAGGSIPAAKVGSGWITRGARAIVGEGRAAWPEYVIPTDPAYRSRAQQLAVDLWSKIGDQAGVRAKHAASLGGLRPQSVGGGWNTTPGHSIGSIIGGVVGIARDIAGSGLAAAWPVLSESGGFGTSIAASAMNSVRTSAINAIKGTANTTATAGAAAAAKGPKGTSHAYASGGMLPAGMPWDPAALGSTPSFPNASTLRAAFGNAPASSRLRLAAQSGSGNGTSPVLVQGGDTITVNARTDADSGEIARDILWEKRIRR